MAASLRTGDVGTRTVFKPITAGLVAGVFVLHAAPCQAVTYSDGNVHVIDGSNSPITSTVFVYDSSIGNPTTIQIESGGVVEDQIQLNDFCLMSMRSGFVADSIFLDDDSQAIIRGGRIDGSLILSNRSSVTMLGGITQDSTYFVKNDSTFDIKGGVLGDELQASNRSVVTIYGQMFNRPYGEITNDFGMLSGILSNGDPFSLRYFRDIDATIRLVEAPAPTSATPLIALGAIAAIRRRR